MARLCIRAGAALLTMGLAMNVANAADNPLAPWRWHARLLLLFAPSAQNDRLVAQQNLLAGDAGGLRERDLVVIPIVGDHAPAFSDPASAATLRRRFDVPQDRFAAVLIGKDGGEKDRSAQPIQPTALFAVIDRMPMRRQEMSAAPPSQ